MMAEGWLVGKWSGVFSLEISMGESLAIEERNIPPQLFQEVKQILEHIMQQGVIWSKNKPLGSLYHCGAKGPHP